MVEGSLSLSRDQLFEARIYRRHLDPLQAADCGGSISLEVGGKWETILLLSKQFHENFRSKTTRLGVGNENNFSQMQNGAWCIVRV